MLLPNGGGKGGVAAPGSGAGPEGVGAPCTDESRRVGGQLPAEVDEEDDEGAQGQQGERQDHADPAALHVARCGVHLGGCGARAPQSLLGHPRRVQQDSCKPDGE